MANEILDDRNTQTSQEEWDNGGIDFHENTNAYKLVRALVSQADRIDDDLEDIRDAHHINGASGKQLDKIGERLVKLNRKDGETDDKYRARLKVQFRVGNIGTTFDEFAEFASVVLDTNIGNIDYLFNYSGNPATVQVATESEVYTNTALTRQEAQDFLSRGVPAGHTVEVLERGTFLLKSDGDTDDATKGLTSDSSSDGGTLATDII